MYLISIFISLLIFQNSEPKLLITGGKNTNFGQFPYQISYQLNFNGQYIHFCGGSILSNKWVLTAGHCITEAPFKSNGIVVAGIVNVTDKIHGQIVGVSQQITHPNFQGSLGPNDIALLKLNKSLIFNQMVQPINLPTSELIYFGKCNLTGWGSTSQNWSPMMPQILQNVEVQILPQSMCNMAISKLIGKEKNPFSNDSNICTGPLNSHISACSGDSGGPLVQNGKIIGIVSWGILPCGSTGSPSVFTKVSHFVKFIREIIVF